MPAGVEADPLQTGAHHLGAGLQVADRDAVVQDHAAHRPFLPIVAAKHDDPVGADATTVQCLGKLASAATSPFCTSPAMSARNNSVSFRPANLGLTAAVTPVLKLPTSRRNGRSAVINTRMADDDGFFGRALLSGSRA